jgi:hypothetical protein
MHATKEHQAKALLVTQELLLGAIQNVPAR